MCSLALTGRRRRAPLVFGIKDPPPEGLLVASHAPTARVWEPVRELQRGASAKLALFELLAVGRVWHGVRGLVSARVSQRRVFGPSVRIPARKRTMTQRQAMLFVHKAYFFFFRAGRPPRLSGWSAVAFGRIDAGNSE